MRPASLLFGFAACLIAAVAIGAGPAPAETPKRGGILTYMIPADAPPSFDGHRESTYATIHSAAPFYSTLIQVNPEESQFLESRQYSEAQCARIMGPGVAEVLGYSTGSTLTYANIVDRDVEMLKYSANRWLQRVERILSSFLPRPQFVLFDRDSFLDTSIAQRWQVNKTKLDTGAYVINEIRRKDNLEDVPWGNKPLALTLGEQKAGPTDPGNPPPDPSGDPTPPDPNAGGAQ